MSTKKKVHNTKLSNLLWTPAVFDQKLDYKKPTIFTGHVYEVDELKTYAGKKGDRLLGLKKRGLCYPAKSLKSCKKRFEILPVGATDRPVIMIDYWPFCVLGDETGDKAGFPVPVRAVDKNKYRK